MNLLVLTTPGNGTLYVNPDHIETIEDFPGGGALITFGIHNEREVLETAAAIAQMLGGS